MFHDLLVTHGGLDLAAADLRTAAADLGGVLHDLEARLAGLAPSFTGAAADAYRHSSARWDAALEEMTTILHELAATVDAVNQSYLAADLQASRLFA